MIKSLASLNVCCLWLVVGQGWLVGGDKIATMLCLEIDTHWQLMASEMCYCWISSDWQSAFENYLPTNTPTYKHHDQSLILLLHMCMQGKMYWIQSNVYMYLSLIKLNALKIEFPDLLEHRQCRAFLPMSSVTVTSVQCIEFDLLLCAPLQPLKLWS